MTASANARLGVERNIGREADLFTAHQTMRPSGASVEMTVFGEWRESGLAALDNPLSIHQQSWQGPRFAMKLQRMGYPFWSPFFGMPLSGFYWGGVAGGCLFLS
jgi:hypothetical protein